MALDRCHSTPPGPLKRWNCTWDEKHLGIEHDFELKGMELRRLLRLRPDYKDEEGWRPTRVEFMTIAAREALRDGHCRLLVDSSGIGSFAVKSMKSLAPLKTSIFVYGKHSTLRHSSKGARSGDSSETIATRKLASRLQVATGSSSITSSMKTSGRELNYQLIWMLTHSPSLLILAYISESI